MIKIENTEVSGFEAAVRGCRNPKNSWAKSDSITIFDAENKRTVFTLGNADRKLALQLIAAGTDHSKFMRMITVTCDITAPMFFNAELDTYKVGTVRNSCSKMHKLADNPIRPEDFSADELMADEVIRYDFSAIVGTCEYLRNKYKQTGDKKYWRMLIELLPESYNQRYTWQANYAVLRNIYFARRNHKLKEWHTFCDWIESIPCSELITYKGGANHDG